MVKQILTVALFCSKPVGTIHSAEATFDSKAPTVASFSSTGPNLISPGIMKVVRIDQKQ
jgi:hypothetical protein